MSMSHSKSVRAYLSVCLGLTLLIATLLPHAAAQQQCPTIPTTGPTNAWAQNSQVTVDIDSHYSSAQRACIQQGILRWQNANGASDASGVRITFTVGVGELSHNSVVLQQAPAGATYRTAMSD